MKKLLALLLLSPLVVSEEGNNNLKVTCELPMPLYINYDFNNDMGEVNFYTKLFPDSSPNKFKKNYKIKKITKDDEIYEITFNKFQLVINRYTMKAWMTVNHFALRTFDGQCFKGFKEYTEKQI